MYVVAITKTLNNKIHTLRWKNDDFWLPHIPRGQLLAKHDPNNTMIATVQVADERLAKQVQLWIIAHALCHGERTDDTRAGAAQTENMIMWRDVCGLSTPLAMLAETLAHRKPVPTRVITVCADYPEAPTLVTRINGPLTAFVRDMYLYNGAVYEDIRAHGNRMKVNILHDNVASDTADVLVMYEQVRLANAGVRLDIDNRYMQQLRGYIRLGVQPVDEHGEPVVNVDERVAAKVDKAYMNIVNVGVEDPVRLQWRRLADYITMATAHYAQVKRERLARPVQCVETGRVYANSDLADTDMNYGKDSVRIAVHRGSAVHGLHWRYITKDEFACITGYNLARGKRG